MIQINTVVLGEMSTNCYCIRGKDGRAVVIDPAARGDRIAAWLEQQGLTLDAIFLTHAHFDHIGGLKLLQEKTGAPVYLKKEDLAIVPVLSYGRMTDDSRDYGETVTAAGLEFKVLHTPGHTPGSVCLLVEKALFSGDTLFAGCCGRTDLAGGDPTEMSRSLKKLYTLEGNYTVYPGHEDPTELDTERRVNPYLREAGV